MIVRYGSWLLAASAFVIACSSSDSTTNGSPQTPDAGETADSGATPDEDAGEDAGTPDPLAACTKDPGPATVTFDPNSAEDPIGSDKFTLAQALAGFPESSGTLTALITTEQGAIRCTFDEANAPATVANFVGLARGTRPYKDGTTWKVGRLYDGLIWHRVIPGFVIQGGDPKGTGSGGPGYDLPQENHVDEPLGTLAMAAGTAPSGSQFYIVVGTGPAADYNVFGKCDVETAQKIAEVPRNSNDKPRTPVHMQRVDIARCPK
ncbi:Peptidyl-prolyl cis-trans isomerase [Labilithrix luteola]|uniref:Peptidyl-prolyl cis-trans isomerase n=1 Tax=Labilithrix luteola TaxID=1391654 RepID=A0A0K1Q4W9_9BACT|nr:peptidylprolyl isomerase [Labilithrix luteola]AKV00881.1 Peptidyl-prolyl cis-trans isomerase [Labilithrix luteola]